MSWLPWDPGDWASRKGSLTVSGCPTGPVLSVSLRRSACGNVALACERRDPEFLECVRDRSSCRQEDKTTLVGHQGLDVQRRTPA